MRSKFLNGLLSSCPLCHFVFLAITHTDLSSQCPPNQNDPRPPSPMDGAESGEGTRLGSQAAPVLTPSWSLVNSAFAFTFYCANSASRCVSSPTHSLLLLPHHVEVDPVPSLHCSVLFPTQH